MPLVNVAVCGTVRSSLEAHLVFNEIMAGKEAGIIGRALFVDWEEDLEQKHPKLKPYLLEHGIDVLPIPPRPGMTSNDVQMSQLHAALSLFDDDDLVLRTRVDKAFPLLRTFLTNAHALVERCLCAPDSLLFDHTILTAAVCVSRPFCHADLQLLGQARDFRRIINMDHYFDVFCDQAHEAQWFALPFIQAYPDIRTLFETVSLRDFVKALRFWAKTDFPMPDALVRTLAHYYDLCRRHFSLMSDAPLPEGLTLRQAIDGGDPTGWDWGTSTFIGSNEWMGFLRTGERCDPFCEELRHFATGDRHPSLSASDVGAIRGFVGHMLGVDEKTLWCGNAYKPGRLAKSSGSAPAPGLEEIVRTIAHQISPGFDTAIASRSLSAISHICQNYPPNAFNEFGIFLEKAATSICAEIAATGKDKPLSNEALLLPAIFHSAAVAFSNNPGSASWLGQALLEGKLAEPFDSFARWGLSARIWAQPPYVVFLLGLLLFKGIGGPADKTEGLRLITAAAESGDESAKAFLKGLGARS